jgi:hypothetical protein
VIFASFSSLIPPFLIAGCLEEGSPLRNRIWQVGNATGSVDCALGLTIGLDVRDLIAQVTNALSVQSARLRPSSGCSCNAPTMIAIVALRDDDIYRTFTSLTVVTSHHLGAAHVLVLEPKRLAHLHFFEQIFSVDLGLGNVGHEPKLAPLNVTSTSLARRHNIWRM